MHDSLYSHLCICEVSVGNYDIYAITLQLVRVDLLTSTVDVIRRLEGKAHVFTPDSMQERIRK